MCLKCSKTVLNWFVHTSFKIKAEPTFGTKSNGLQKQAVNGVLTFKLGGEPLSKTAAWRVSNTRNNLAMGLPVALSKAKKLAVGFVLPRQSVVFQTLQNDRADGGFGFFQVAAQRVFEAQRYFFHIEGHVATNRIKPPGLKMKRNITFLAEL